MDAECQNKPFEDVWTTKIMGTLLEDVLTFAVLSFALRTLLL